jgi:hypothetical protein
MKNSTIHPAMLQPNAIVEHWAKAHHTGPGHGLPASPCQPALPSAHTARAPCTWARREHRGGDPAASDTTATTQHFLRVNKLQALSYMPLHLDQHEVAGKRVHTGEMVGAEATDNVDGGNGSQLCP